MSQENVEIVRRIYDEYVARPEAVRELYHPDYETDVTDVAPDFDVIRGFDAALEALRSYMETFEDFYIELEEVIHADEEHVVVEVRDGGRVPGSDSEVRNHRFHVCLPRRQGRSLLVSPRQEQRPRSRRVVGIAALDEKQHPFREILRGRCRRRTSSLLNAPVRSGRPRTRGSSWGREEPP